MARKTLEVNIQTKIKNQYYSIVQAEDYYYFQVFNHMLSRFLKRVAGSEHKNYKDGIIGENFYEQVSSSTGSSIKSKHISEMLQINFPSKPDELGNLIEQERPIHFRAWLEHYKYPKWNQIAEKQERGGIIRAKASKLLTIPNPNHPTAPNSRARHYKARWVPGNPPTLRLDKKRGKTLIESRVRSGRKAQRGRTRARRYTPKSPARRKGKSDVLFFGYPYVRLKPKKFWEKTLNNSYSEIRDEMKAAIRFGERYGGPS